MAGSSEFINHLRMRIAEVRAQMARLQTDLATYERELELYESSNASAAIPTRAEPISQAPRVPEVAGYVGLSIGDAAVKFLKNHGGLATSHEIWSALHQAGYEFETKHPVQAVRQALRKRLLNEDGIFAVNQSTFGHKDNYTPNKIAKLKQRHAGRGGKSSEEHGTATSEGMRRAASKGVRFGPAQKLDVKRAEEMLREGRKVSEVCTTFKVTRPAVYRYFNSATIKRFRSEGPVHGATESDPPQMSEHLRVVK